MAKGTKNLLNNLTRSRESDVSVNENIPEEKIEKELTQPKEESLKQNSKADTSTKIIEKVIEEKENKDIPVVVEKQLIIPSKEVPVLQSNEHEQKRDEFLNQIKELPKSSGTIRISNDELEY